MHKHTLAAINVTYYMNWTTGQFKIERLANITAKCAV